jgi:hypothetical protein
MPKGEIHVQLSVHYADGSLADVHPLARLLYVDALCKAKETLNDGTFTRAQLAKVAYWATPKQLDAYLRELVAEPADGKASPLTRNDNGTYTVSAWLARNPSRADVAARRTGDRGERSTSGARGAHVKNHVNRGVRRPESCPFCATDGPGSGVADSQSSVANSQAPPSSATSSAKATSGTETETETETTATYVPASGADPYQAADDPGGASGPAESLLAEHVAIVGKVNRNTLNELGQQIADLLRQEYTLDEIRAGLGLWRKGSTWPSHLPVQVDRARQGGLAGGWQPIKSANPNPYLADLRDALGAPSAIAALGEAG